MQRLFLQYAEMYEGLVCFVLMICCLVFVNIDVMHTID